MDDERCRVTVVGRQRRVDLAVPAHAAIAEYLPDLLKLCGQDDADAAFPPVWSLASTGAKPFALESSLAESGVADGATLYLRDSAAGEFDEPVVTDLEELVDEAGRSGAVWGARQRARATVLLGLAGVLAGFAALAEPWRSRPAAAAGAIVVGIGLLGLGRQATRRGWPLPLIVRLAVVLSAVPLWAFAADSLTAAQGATSWSLSWSSVDVSLGALLGAVAARLALRHVITLVALAFTALSLPVAVLLAALDATPVQAAAVLAVVALAVLSGAPTTSGHLATWAVPPLPAGKGSVASRAELAQLVDRGRRVLVGINSLASAVLACCLAVLGSTGQVFALALAGCLSLCLVARSGQVRTLAGVLPVLAAGIVGLVVVVLYAPGRFGAPGWLGSAILEAAGALALAFGLHRAVHPADEEADGTPGRLGLPASALTLLCLPLALGVFGAFGYLVRLGESW